MPELTWTGRGTFSYHDGLVPPGESVTVDESTADELLSHRSGGWERVDDSESDSDDADTASVAAPFDPDDYTVDELEAEVESGDYSDAELDALAEAERDGKDRATALEAIDEER